MKTLWMYGLGTFAMLVYAFVSFRVLLRRDYLAKDRVGSFSFLLELLVFGLYLNFPYIYLPYPWPVLPILPDHGASRLVGLGLVVFGVVLAVTGITTLGFRRFLGFGSGTLIRGGIYQLTRNPQIVGFFYASIGFAVLWPSWYALGWLTMFVPVFHMMVITEEEYLEHLHGAVYQEYCRCVPRYLGRAAGRLDGDL